eukprot:gb/GECH01000564.1/.p1 GENE.gb/GECH01000564.1/~~gb/GECH01000564.1/.p1  ORF type:complete len:108 (+),score=23.20 gb/GECH01000564.1/:1-324(+)
MVCSKCEKKLKKVVVPDKWKDGANNSKRDPKKTNTLLKMKSGASSSSNKTKKSRLTPYKKPPQCKLCKSVVYQDGMSYCHTCAYKRGICAMCGKEILGTKFYKQSTK